MQEEMLARLSTLKNAGDFYRMIPETLDILREYSRRVLKGECRIEDMIITARISRSIRDYRQSNNNTAAMRQFQKEGITIQPGQSIRYVLTDHASKSYMKRVKIAELMMKARSMTGASIMSSCFALVRAYFCLLDIRKMYWMV